MYSDSLMEKLLSEEVPTEDEIHAVTKAAVHAQSITPVFCGSAYKTKGVQALLERQGVREVRLEAEPAGQLQPGQLARGGHGSHLQQAGRAVAQRGAAGPELPA